MNTTGYDGKFATVRQYNKLEELYDKLEDLAPELQEIDAVAYHTLMLSLCQKIISLVAGTTVVKEWEGPEAYQRRKAGL